MRASQVAALRELCGLQTVEFQVGGSVLLYALGLDVEPRDIDIVLPVEAKEALRSAAGQWWRSGPGKAPGVVESDWLVNLVIGGEPVEAMGGMALWVGGRLRRLPYRRGPSWDMDGVEVPLAPPGQWLVLYRRYQPARAELLAPLVDAADVAVAELELEDGDLHYGNSG